MALTAALIAAGLFPSAPARAQLAVQRSTETVLLLPPVPKNAADSAFAIRLGDALRKRLEAKLRLKLRIVPKDKMAEALGSSGFPPDAILDENGANQLARFINVDAYVTGEVERNTVAPRVVLRLVDNRRSGLSGWVRVRGAAGQSLDDFVNTVVDSVDQQVKAAEQARECLERRDRQEYGSARDRAERAFRLFPNHPATALCVSSVFEALKAPPDSMIVMLKRAVAGDSLLVKAWDMLARQHQAKGDSAGWAEALIKTVEIDPTDMRKRLGTAALLYQIKRYPRAAALIDDGLERSPGDPQAIGLKAQVCFDGQMWDCAVDALSARYQADSTVQNDSLYILKLLAATQATNDTAAVENWSRLPPTEKHYYRPVVDTLAMEEWTGIGVKKFPNSLTFWRARAVALKANGKNEEAIQAFSRVAELDPKDFGSRFQAAQLLGEKLQAVIDSLGKLDTTRLRETKATADSLIAARYAPVDAFLTQAEGVAVPEAKLNVGVLYFTPATKLVQARLRPDLAIDMLNKALPLVASNNQLAVQTNFFLGLSYVYHLGSAFDMAAIQKNRDCKGVASLGEYVAKTKAAMVAGASVQQQTADQVLKTIANIENFVPQARKAWKCK